MSIDVGRRLLATCHYRYDERIGRLWLVKACVWLDGNDLGIKAIREAMRVPSPLDRSLLRAIERERVLATRDPVGDPAEDTEIVGNALVRWAPFAELMRSTRATERIGVAQELASLSDEPWLSDLALRALSVAAGGSGQMDLVAFQRKYEEVASRGIARLDDVTDDELAEARDAFAELWGPLEQVLPPGRPRAEQRVMNFRLSLAWRRLPIDLRERATHELLPRGDATMATNE
jgi:hypothetical protein